MDSSSIFFGMLLTGLIVSYILVGIIGWLTISNQKTYIKTAKTIDQSKEDLKTKVFNLTAKNRQATREKEDLLNTISSLKDINKAQTYEIDSLKQTIEDIYAHQKKYKDV
jgi:hypothetical protein